jgi:glyoxylase-like metal-dependent hydrolase (beta-lactamase superfamily II)
MTDLGDIIVTSINAATYKLYVSDYVYMYVFRGPQGTLLIDTGCDVDEVKLKQTLAELNCSDVRYIVNTHSNGDHVDGNHFFTSAVIIAHEKCRENLQRQPEFPAAGLPNLTLNDSITLYFNSEEIRVIALPGGHTNDDVIVHFVKANLVFLGDIIVADTFPVIWLDHYEGTSVGKLTGNLQRIMQMFPDDIRIISSHGRDYTKDELKEYYLTLAQTIDIIRSAAGKGKSLEEIQKTSYSLSIPKIGSWGSRNR